MVNAFIANEKDDVVTVLEPVNAGDTVTYLLQGEELSFTALDNVPKYHKVARREVGADRHLIKYGEVIGLTTADIHTGNHVHTQNLTDVPREEAMK